MYTVVSLPFLGLEQRISETFNFFAECCHMELKSCFPRYFLPYVSSFALFICGIPLRTLFGPGNVCVQARLADACKHYGAATMDRSARQLRIQSSHALVNPYATTMFAVTTDNHPRSSLNLTYWLRMIPCGDFAFYNWLWLQAKCTKALSHRCCDVLSSHLHARNTYPCMEINNTFIFYGSHMLVKWQWFDWCPCWKEAVLY